MPPAPTSRRLPALAAAAALCVLAAIGPSCGLIEYSPYTAPLDDHERGRTAANLAELAEQDPGQPPFRFAFITDTQRWPGETDALVDALNRRDDLDFVLHGGDITQFSLVEEYRLMQRLFRRIEVPVLTVIGNHDMQANGRAIYGQMYGPRNYSFVYGRTKFVLHDNNSLEYAFSGDVPDLKWLAAQLEPAPSWDRAFVVGHVPPSHTDFDRSLEDDYGQLLDQSGVVLLSLHGHDHRYDVGTLADSQVPYVVGDDVGGRNYVIVEVDADGFSHQRVSF